MITKQKYFKMIEIPYHVEEDWISTLYKAISITVWTFIKEWNLTFPAANSFYSFRDGIIFRWWILIEYLISNKNHKLW